MVKYAFNVAHKRLKRVFWFTTTLEVRPRAICIASIRMALAKHICFIRRRLAAFIALSYDAGGEGARVMIELRGEGEFEVRDLRVSAIHRLRRVTSLSANPPVAR